LNVIALRRNLVQAELLRRAYSVNGSPRDIRQKRRLMAQAMTGPHFAAARAAGDLLFISGQIALGSEGRLVGKTVQAQTQQCLANLETVLAAHGLRRTDVVKTTVWLKSPADFCAFHVIYNKFFGEHRPAQSALCAQFVIPQALVAIEAIADLH
jgi:2-iminobutanoate/2-iminopropanoate deaminase